MNSLTILGALALFAAGYAAAELHSAWLRHRHIQAHHRAIQHALRDLRRIGLVVMNDDGRYVANPDLSPEEAEAIALANDIDIHIDRRFM